MFFLDVNFIFALAFSPKSNKTVENKKLETSKVVVPGEGGAIKLKNQNLPFFELPGTTKK